MAEAIFGLLKFALVAVPTYKTAVKMTMQIRASITAYSTAVGPSSFVRNSASV
jgi:hypothetical protein